MRKFSPKYLRFLSCLILTGYVYLSAFNILHYHEFDLRAGNYAIESGENSGQANSNGFTDLNIQCTSHQNYSSLHTFSSENSRLSTGGFENVTHISFSKNNLFSNSEYFKAHPLRAPPLSV